MGAGMNEIIGALLPWVLGLAGFSGVLLWARRSGRNEAERDADKALIDGMKKSRDARDEIAQIDDAGVRDRARQRMRDNTRS